MLFFFFQQPNECGDSRRMQKFNKILTDNYGPVLCPSEELSVVSFAYMVFLNKFKFKKKIVFI